jgi:NMT1 family protein
VKSLGEFKGRRIMVGTPMSGTRRVATLLLKANGVTAENSRFIEQDFPADAKPLTGDGADVAFVSLPPDAQKVQDLLRAPGILLMDFAAEAEAYITRFPFLSKVVMYRGAVEFDPDIPSADITLLATAPALVVRKDLHPALVSLLTHAAWVNPKPGFDRSGEPILFYRAGQFPNPDDPEFEVDADAKAYYKSAELPVLLRAVGPLATALGLPFWVTAFAFLNTTKILLLAIPLLSITIPLTRFLPSFFTWLVRQRLLKWYDRLKELELALEHDPSRAQLEEAGEGLRKLDRAVSRMPLPRHLAEKRYNLRSHIELVAQKLVARRAM